MLQYRESLIFGNLKDNLALQEQQLVVLFYYSLFYSIEIKISWFCAISHYFISPLARERNQTN